jgi:hypothetical protein
MSADIHGGGCRVQLRETESETKVTPDPSVTAALVLAPQRIPTVKILQSSSS